MKTLKYCSNVLIRRKSSSGSFNGGYEEKHHFQEKLNKYLVNQGEISEATYKTTHKNGYFFATVNFKSFFAAMNQQPKPSEYEAIESAAREALIQQGLSADFGDTCHTLDAYCRKETKEPPEYHITEFSAGVLYNTSIQVFNENMIKSNHIYLQAIVSLHQLEKINCEQYAARLLLLDQSLNKIMNKNYKKELNEYCIRNGGTIPFYNKDSYSTTVTSLIKNKISRTFSKPKSCVNKRDLENKKQNQKLPKTFTGLDVDMLESMSIQLMRDPLQAEESAAKAMITSLQDYLPENYSEQSIETEFPHKAKLKLYSEKTNCPVSYHTETIESSTKLYDCMVVSRCLNKAPANFSIACEGAGKETKNAACESAARKSIILLGLDPKSYETE